MYELFKTNADCIRMAASAKACEVRDQWNELAAHWRSKADACNLQPHATAISESIRHLESSSSMSPELSAPQTQVSPAAAVVSKAPKAALRLVPSVAAPLAPRDEQVALDAIWQALQSPAKSAPSAVT
jgi:hypothetical protein